MRMGDLVLYRPFFSHAGPPLISVVHTHTSPSIKRSNPLPCNRPQSRPHSDSYMYMLQCIDLVLYKFTHSYCSLFTGKTVIHSVGRKFLIQTHHNENTASAAGMLPKVLSLLALACAAGIIAAAVIDIAPWPTGDGWLTSILVHVYVILFAALLATSCLIKSQLLLHHFGFLRYAAGIGLNLIFLGSLTIWWAGWVGKVASLGSITWGVVCISVHFCLGRRSTPTNEPLLMPAF